MTRAEVYEATKLFNEAATPASVGAFANRDAMGLDLADRMSQAFEMRRRELRYPRRALDGKRERQHCGQSKGRTPQQPARGMSYLVPQSL